MNKPIKLILESEANWFHNAEYIARLGKYNFQIHKSGKLKSVIAEYEVDDLRKFTELLIELEETQITYEDGLLNIFILNERII